MKTTRRHSVVIFMMILMAAGGLFAGKAKAAGSVAINSTNFPDATFRSYVRQNFDTDGNGSLSQAEIRGVTWIDVDNMSVGSLKGIEFFSALEDLYCEGNNIKTLDLSGCPALNNLFCGSNSLTSLDVSGCPKLWYLSCDNNQIKSLDLSGCPEMMDLECQCNQLKSLNLSGCSEIFWLDCMDNDLTALDISDCPELVFLFEECEHIVNDEHQLWEQTDEEGMVIKRLLCDSSVTVVARKLSITSSPKSQTVTAGSTAKFTVKATGTGLKYQWQWRTSSSGTWKNSTSATTGYNKATLKVSATTARHGYQYRCKVTDAAGNTKTSSAATLNVLGIKTQPSSVETVPGETVTFRVAATGTGLKYQWQWRTSSSGTWKNSTSATAGYNSNTLSVSATAARRGYQYRCQVKDSAGNTVYSNAASLIVLGIKTQPGSVSMYVGKTATFKVVAMGTGKAYQWQYRTSASGIWKNCSSSTTGYNTATLKVVAKTYRNGYQYRCQVSYPSGYTEVSKEAKLTVVTESPFIATQPKDLTVEGECTEVTWLDLWPLGKFTVVAYGEDLQYQWEEKGADGTWNAIAPCVAGWMPYYSGETTDTLVIYQVDESEPIHYYRCVITDKNGNSVTSRAAKLTVHEVY